MKLFCLFLLPLLFVCEANAGNVSSLSYAATNVTTGAYVTLVASTPIHVANLVVCDNSGHILKIAVGAAGSEVDLVSVPLNACMVIPVGPILKLGARLSIRAIDASATTGYNVVSFVQ